MEEKEVKEQTKKYLEERDYKVTEEPKVSEEVRLDLFAFKYVGKGQRILTNKTKTRPDALWIECKGDVGFSAVLEGLVRTAFAIYINGGQGMLSLPMKQYLLMRKYKNFMDCKKELEVICVEGKIESFMV